MITISKICVPMSMLDNALYGMRNPLNSWDSSDSYYCDETCDDCEKWDSENELCSAGDHYVIGPKDMDLTLRLCKAGPEHRKHLRQVPVSMQIKAPLYFWKEMDTYKVGTVAVSTSTMHTLHRRALSLDDFSHDGMRETQVMHLQRIIEIINDCRQEYINTHDKTYWLEMIKLLPESYEQTRMWSGNYAVLLNQYRQRKNHKLPEWHAYLNRLLADVPYLAEIIVGMEASNESK